MFILSKISHLQMDVCLGGAWLRSLNLDLTVYCMQVFYAFPQPRKVTDL
jgi:hypothetical protein